MFDWLGLIYSYMTHDIQSNPTHFIYKAQQPRPYIPVSRRRGADWRVLDRKESESAEGASVQAVS